MMSLKALVITVLGLVIAYGEASGEFGVVEDVNLLLSYSDDELFFLELHVIKVE